MASTPTTVTPPSTPIIPLSIVEHINDSWCELQFKSGCSSTSSTSHLHHSVNPEVLEKLLHEAQKETNFPSTSISVQSSPKSPQTPIIIPHYHHYTTNEDTQMQATTNCTNCNNQTNAATSSILTTIPSTICDISGTRQEFRLNKDTDWIWYWSSRPQMQPPKEWNFVHPNSSKSKYSVRKHELMDNKLLSRDTINKLIFTHMASFILGATL